jgi:uncharacterized repeat protein (TIGR01451 family)
VADLVVTKTVGASSVAAGGTVNWTLAIANSGPDTSNGSVVTDTLPAGLTPTSVSSSVPDACSISGQVVTCQAGEIVPGSGYEALIVTTVSDDYAGAQITNTATLAPGSEADPNAANNTSSAVVSVNRQRQVNSARVLGVFPCVDHAMRPGHRRWARHKSLAGRIDLLGVNAQLGTHAQGKGALGVGRHHTGGQIGGDTRHRRRQIGQTRRHGQGHRRVFQCGAVGVNTEIELVIDRAKSQS